MTQTFTLLGFVKHLAVLEADMRATEDAIIMKACIMVCNAAKSALGSYEFGWPPLKPETIARKLRGDSPLLETAELKNSIQWQVVSHGEGAVGSDLPKAEWMEYGTSRVPEKMMAALEQTRRKLEAEITPILGAEMAAVIATGFVRAVVGCRREIEVAAEMPPLVN